MLKIYDIIFEEKNIELAHWDQTKWLVFSSFFFMFPSIYAYFNQLYFYSILLLFTSLISANYWRKATYSWRRNMDLFFAKISFVVFAYTGIIYVNYTPYLILGYSDLIMVAYFYYLSDKLYNLKNNNWYKYHFIFHFFLMKGQHIILKGLSRNIMLRSQNNIIL